MAGDWIKMNKSLFRDPRVVRISSALKADRLRTVGGLLSAWSLFDEQTSDGILPGYTPEVLDELINFPGLASAMQSVGWLEIGDDFLMIPRFEEHNGKSAKRRAQESVRKMSARKADKRPQTEQIKSALEKRREEKSIKIERESMREEFPDMNPPRRRPTLSEAKSAAANIGITESKAEEWWNCREASDWQKGMSGGATSPVGSNWQADLTTYARRGGFGAENSNSHREEKQSKEFPEKITIKHL